MYYTLYGREFMKRFYLLIAALLAITAAGTHALPINGTGTMAPEFVLYQDSQDDDDDTTLIHGIKVPLRLVLMGRSKPLDWNLVTNFYYNQWNEFELDLLTINLKGKMAGKDYKMVLGDAYVRHRPLTIMNRKIFGLNGTIALLKEQQRDLLTLQLLGGVSKWDQEEDAPVANQIYRRSASTATYRQYLGAGILKYPPFPGFNAELVGLYAKDNTASTESLAVGIENIMYGAHLDYAILEEKVFFDADINFSSYDMDLSDEEKAVGDKAFRFGVDGRVGGAKFKGMFNLIGPDYYTAGYPYLQTDRLGGFGEAGYTVKGIMQGDVSYEFYQDNLAGDTLSHTVSTNKIEVDLNTSWNRNPNISISYDLKSEKSPQLDDNTLVDRNAHTVGGGIDINFKQVRGSFNVSNKIIFDDSQLYVQEGDEVDSTIYDQTNQLSLSTSVRYRPSRAISFLAGASNVFATSVGRDAEEKVTLINYIYFSVISSLAKGRYRPTLDFIFSNYKDKADAKNNTDLIKVKPALEYRLSRAQSAKLYYILEMANRVNDDYSKTADYLANSIGAEYTVIF